MSNVVAMFDFSDWRLVKKSDFGMTETLLYAYDFETLLRNAASGGYLRLPIVVPITEMP